MYILGKQGMTNAYFDSHEHQSLEQQILYFTIL